MKPVALTDSETGPELVMQLAHLRAWARQIIRAQDTHEICRKAVESIRDAAPGTPASLQAVEQLVEMSEFAVEMRFSLIEIGNYLMPLCAALDQKADREAIFEALCVNRGHRDSDAMRKYGDKSLHLIAVLDLENSATRDDDILIKPLKWCYTRAFMQALNTSPALDRIVHEEANATFGGVFGDFQDRPLMDRLAGRSA